MTARRVGGRSSRRLSGAVAGGCPWPAAVAALVLAALMGACDGSSSDGQARGEELFSNNCAVCHGAAGQGMPTGPPLVHPLYVPEQTSDAAFAAAMRDGADEEHFEFGIMPAVAGLSDEEIAAITGHIRELQRDAGLID